MILTGHGQEINWREKQRTLTHNTIEIECEGKLQDGVWDSGYV